MCQYVYDCKVIKIIAPYFHHHGLHQINFKVSSLATGRVLAAELPNYGNMDCTVLYPASAKASNEIGKCLKYMVICDFLDEHNYRVLYACWNSFICFTNIYLCISGEEWVVVVHMFVQLKLTSFCTELTFLSNLLYATSTYHFIFLDKVEYLNFTIRSPWIF